MRKISKFSMKTEIQLNPAITDLKGPTNFMRYCRIALLPKGLSLTIFFAIFFSNYLTSKNERKKPFALQSNEKHFQTTRILLTTNADGWAGGQGHSTPHSPSLNTYHFKCAFSPLSTRASKMNHEWDKQTSEVSESRRQFKILNHN